VINVTVIVLEIVKLINQEAGMTQFKMVIAENSCNGEEKQFEQWMNENYPEIDTIIENTLDGGLYDDDGNRIENENYWDKYSR
jgi:hypothetical protein